MSSGAPATAVAQSALETRLQSLTAELASVESHLWALAAVAAGLDVLLTFRGLELGLTEGNPVVATLVAGAGIGALVAVKVVVLAVAALGRWYRPRWGPWLSLGLAIPWVIAVGINATLLAAL